MAVLEVAGLERTFGAGRESVHALRGVDLTLEAGEIVGLLGVNGAGKTTLIKVVSTLLLPTAGTVLIDGHDAAADPHTVRRLLSVVMGGERGLYPRLNGLDNIVYFAVLAGLSRREAAQRGRTALERVGLADAAGRRVETYSKGMRQRLHLAIGFITRPRLLLLDEPTVGLDPLEAQRLRGAIAEMRDQGVAILLTSHYLGDIERLASRVAVLRGGVITEDLPLADLMRRVGGAAEVTIHGVGDYRPPAPALAGAGVQVLHSGPDGSAPDGPWQLVVRMRDWAPESLRALADLWPAENVTDVSVQPAGLESVFAELVEAD